MLEKDGEIQDAQNHERGKNRARLKGRDMQASGQPDEIGEAKQAERFGERRAAFRKRAEQAHGKRKTPAAEREQEQIP